MRGDRRRWPQSRLGVAGQGGGCRGSKFAHSQVFVAARGGSPHWVRLEDGFDPLASPSGAPPLAPAPFVHSLASICAPLDPSPLQQKLCLSTGPHGLPWHTRQLRKRVLVTGLCCLGSFGSQSMNPGSATGLTVPLSKGPRPP